MLRHILCLVSLSALLLLVGCSDHEVVQPEKLELAEVSFEKLENVELVRGMDENKAKFEIYMPDPWNGDLVVFARGYEIRKVLPNIDPLRDDLLALEYAVAYSSYSAGGYAVEEGAEDTRKLSTEIFEEYFPPADETYLIGYSMGGIISVMLAEQYPGLYEGVVTYGGMLGGGRREFDYILTPRVLFDYYYPGVVPGSVEYVAKNVKPAETYYAAVAAMQADMAPLYELASVDQADLAYNDDIELINAVGMLVYNQLATFQDVYERCGENPFFGNMDVYYTGTSDDEALNLGVGRYESSVEADAYFEMYYEPTGALSVPVLALQNTRDWLVPASHVTAYEQVVTAAGCEDMFQYELIDRYGHDYTFDEVLAAFLEVVAWAESLE